MKMRLLFITVLMLALPITAQAYLFNFHLIGDDNEPSNDLGPQLQMDVNDNGFGGVDFTIQNIGDIDSVIAQIYFDASSLNFSTPPSLTPTSGVDFQLDPSTPPDLPGGNTITPVFQADWGIDAESPAPQNGINNYAGVNLLDAEALTITFAGQTFANVIGSISTGDLRVGLHVQSIAPNGKSEAYVNNVAPVPEPATMLLFGTGLIGLAGARFRKKK